MLMQVSRDPNGSTQVPLQVMRTAPGGPDQGQTDRSATGTVNLNNVQTIPLWTVGAGKTGHIVDLELYLSASSGTVQLQVGGQTIWQAPVSNTLPAVMRRSWAIPAGAGQLVQLVGPAINATLTFNLGAWEQ